jgi:DNA repair photolyase
MIISASRRTDIPAFYGKWFTERIKEGYTEVRNPYNPNLIRKISLQPADVDCIVFWTRNPGPFLKVLPLLRPYPFYFLFTITPYGHDLEPKVPDKNSIGETFRRLSDIIGKERVIWRYDPIIFSDTMDLYYHIRVFEDMAKALSACTSKCVISFLTFYNKIVRKLMDHKIRQPETQEMTSLMKSLSHIGHAYGLEIASCASEIAGEEYGVKPNRCIDNEFISHLSGKILPYSKDKNQRVACGCHESVDIGTYNSCGYQCLYCYANK